MILFAPIIGLVVLAVIDPNWAIPANTGLLIILTVINARYNRKGAKRADAIQKEVVDVKLKCGADRREEDQESISEIREKVHTETPPTLYGRRYTDEFPEVEDN